MPDMSQYQKNKEILLQNAINYFKQVQDQLFPCKMIGCSVTNFKSLEEIKKAE